MDEFLSTKLFAGTEFAVTVSDLAIALGILLVAALVSIAVHMGVRAAATRVENNSIRGAIIHALHGPLRWAIGVLGLWIAYLHLAQQPLADGLKSMTFLAVQLPFLMWFATRLTDNWTTIWSGRAEDTEGTFDDQLVPVIRTLVKLVIFVVGLLLIFQNLGYEVGSLLAGLGIGGAAIALASKDTIANLFGSIVVFVDRPFQVGDWVEIGSHEGTVEEVGLRVTRIRTFANSLITVPNSTFTTTAINNWSRMHKRRLKLTIGVTYDAKPEQLQAGVAAVREILANDERVSQDFSLVNFTNFGPSSLDIFIYAFTISTNWVDYMQAREDLLLAFMTRFHELGLSFAFPSQSLYVESLPGGEPAAMERELPL